MTEVSIEPWDAGGVTKPLGEDEAVPVELSPDQAEGFLSGQKPLPPDYNSEPLLGSVIGTVTNVVEKGNNPEKPSFSSEDDEYFQKLREKYSDDEGVFSVETEQTELQNSNHAEEEKVEQVAEEPEEYIVPDEKTGEGILVRQLPDGSIFVNGGMIDRADPQQAGRAFRLLDQGRHFQQQLESMSEKLPNS